MENNKIVNEVNQKKLGILFSSKHKTNEQIIRCLDSILNLEDYINVYFVDNSNDKTQYNFLVEKYKKIKNFSFFYRDKDFGKSGTINKYASKMNAKYLIFADPDDLFIRENIINVVNEYLSSDFDLLVSARYVLKQKNKKIKRIKTKHGNLSPHSHLYASHNVIYNKEFYGNFELPKNMNNTEDLFTIVNLFSKTNNIVINNRYPYYVYSEVGSTKISDLKDTKKSKILENFKKTISSISDEEVKYNKDFIYFVINIILTSYVLFLILEGKSTRNAVREINSLFEGNKLVMKSKKLRPIWWNSYFWSTMKGYNFLFKTLALILKEIY